MANEALDELTDAQLWANTFLANGRRRVATAHLVAHLCEVDARRLHVREAYSSLYDFCLRGLGMSEGEAQRHIAGARAARRFPMVLEMLADGRLHLTGLSLLASRLTPENHAKLLDSAAGKTKADIELLVAAWFPKPDVPDQIEKLPAGGSAAGAQPSLGLGGASRPNAGGASEPRPAVTPLSEERFCVKFTGSAELKAKLEHARNLMSHQSRALEVVVERALDALIRELENKRFGKTDRPRQSAGTADGSMSRPAKREIYDRDDGQCTYVSPSGVRCTERAFLEIDHREPRALGGKGDAANGRLLCRTHNQYCAREIFGDKYIDDRIRLRQRRLASGNPAEPSKRQTPADAKAVVAQAEPTEPVQPVSTQSLTPQAHDKLLAALTGLGFRAAPAKKALDVLAKEASAETPALDQLLRKAILLLTPPGRQR